MNPGRVTPSVCKTGLRGTNHGGSVVIQGRVTSISGMFVALCFIQMGCSTGPKFLRLPNSDCACTPAGSEEWWAAKAELPVGVRQRYAKGKLWPPVPRSTDEPQQFTHTFHAVHYWPLPYVYQDRAYMRDMVLAHQKAGWTAAMTIFQYHFDPETDELNNAAAIHLRWMLQVSDSPYPTVYVQATDDPLTNQKRLDSVTAMVRKLEYSAQKWDVQLRYTQAEGRPALEVDTIRRNELSTMPSPRISYGGGSGMDSGSADGSGTTLSN